MDFLNNAFGESGVGEDSYFDSNRLDLGFGMDLNSQHDWSDGQQFDLFDGFFFGNNGPMNGGGNGGDGGGGIKEEDGWGGG